MNDTYMKEFCSECDNEISECCCESTECCDFCENIHSILEKMSITESYEEDFEILHDAFRACQEQCYNQGYTEALRTNAKIMNNLADELSCNCEDCEDCNCDCGCED